MSEQDRLAFWTRTLNLSEFRVVHERRDTPSDPVRFTIVPKHEATACPQCGHACDDVHRRHDSSPVKDLPLGGLCTFFRFAVHPARSYVDPIRSYVDSWQ